MEQAGYQRQAQATQHCGKHLQFVVLAQAIAQRQPHILALDHPHQQAANEHGADQLQGNRVRVGRAAAKHADDDEHGDQRKVLRQ